MRAANLTRRSSGKAGAAPSRPGVKLRGCCPRAAVGLPYHAGWGGTPARLSPAALPLAVCFLPSPGPAESRGCRPRSPLEAFPDPAGVTCGRGQRALSAMRPPRTTSPGLRAWTPSDAAWSLAVTEAGVESTCPSRVLCARPHLSGEGPTRG